MSTDEGRGGRVVLRARGTLRFETFEEVGCEAEIRADERGQCEVWVTPDSGKWPSQMATLLFAGNRRIHLQIVEYDSGIVSRATPADPAELAWLERKP